MIERCAEYDSRQQELARVKADRDAYEARIAEIRVALGAMTEAAEEMESVCWLHNQRVHEQEARIAELEADLDNANAHATWVDGLEAELARVKAESLRVVPVGEARSALCVSIGAYFQHESREYRMFAADMLENEIRASDLFDHCEHIFPGYTIVQPVRLERWEDEG